MHSNVEGTFAYEYVFPVKGKSHHRLAVLTEGEIVARLELGINRMDCDDFLILIRNL